MKKIISLLAVTTFVTQAFAQPAVTNGGFETAAGAQNCATLINNATDWHSLKTTYDIGSCGTATDSKDVAGAYHWENVDACGGAAYLGTRYGEAEYSGDANIGGSTAYNNLIYQTMTNNASSNTCYRATAYVKSIAGFGVSGMLGIFFVNTTVGATAAAIMGNLRSQTLSAGTFTSVGNGWYKMEVDWTPSSTSTYYIVIGNAYGDLCDDSSPQTNKWILDEVSIACRAANAGADRTIACNGSSTLGSSTSCSSTSWSWSPSTYLSCTNCAQPVAHKCGGNQDQVITYTLTVTGGSCSQSTDQVTVTYDGGIGCNCGDGPDPGRFANSGSDTDYNHGVIIYPNPSDGKIIIKAGEEMQSVVITDITGRVVYNKNNLALNDHSVDLSKQPKGIYMIKIMQNGKEHIEKITLE